MMDMKVEQRSLRSQAATKGKTTAKAHADSSGLGG
jgi:hypothetical protein